MVAYNSNKFIVLSISLIAVQTKNSPNSKIDQKDNGVDCKVSRQDQELVVETELCKGTYKKGSKDVFEGVQLEFTQGLATVNTAINELDR